jgi:thioesterase domain-containing protein
MVDAKLLRRQSTTRDISGLVRSFGTALRTLYAPTLRYTGLTRLALCRVEPPLANDGAAEAARQAWRRWLPQLQSWESTGDHFSMLKAPHVQGLANWWSTH